jgi:hypothetical protein
MELQAMLLGLAGAALFGLVGSERNDAAAAMAGARAGAGPAPCRVFGPSYDIQPANDKAPGAPWPAARGVASAEACTALCASAAGCSSFHYYGPGDPAAGLCYLYAAGAPTGPLGDGRQRYAGNCTAHVPAPPPVPPPPAYPCRGCFCEEAFADSSLQVSGLLMYGASVNKKNGQNQTHGLRMYAPPASQLADARARRPAAIVLHGGGFAHGNRDQPDIIPQARRFARHGLVAASIDYRQECETSRSCPVGYLAANTDAMEDARAAVRFLVAHAVELRIDLHRIVAYGESAGGMIAAYMPSVRPPPAAARADARAGPVLTLRPCIFAGAGRRQRRQPGLPIKHQRRHRAERQPLAPDVPLHLSQAAAVPGHSRHGGRHGSLRHGAGDARGDGQGRGAERAGCDRARGAYTARTAGRCAAALSEGPLRIFRAVRGL